MADLTNPRLIYFKGFLCLFSDLIAADLLILENPTLRTAFLVAMTGWCFARFYYFAFYVIQHYVDPGLPLCRAEVVRALSPAEATMKRSS